MDISSSLGIVQCWQKETKGMFAMVDNLESADKDCAKYIFLLTLNSQKHMPDNLHNWSNA